MYMVTIGIIFLLVPLYVKYSICSHSLGLSLVKNSLNKYCVRLIIILNMSALKIHTYANVLILVT